MQVAWMPLSGRLAFPSDFSGEKPCRRRVPPAQCHFRRRIVFCFPDDEDFFGTDGAVAARGAEAGEELEEGVAFRRGNLGGGVEEIAESDFQLFDGNAGLEGDEVASRGDFDEGKPRNVAEKTIVRNEEEGFRFGNGQLANRGRRGVRVAVQGGFRRLDDGLGAVGVDFGETVQNAEGERNRDGTTGFVEFGRASTFVGRMICLFHGTDYRCRGLQKSPKILFSFH